MKNLLKYIFIILVTAAFCGSAFASNYLTGTTRTKYLKWNSSVRSSAMGDTYIALADDAGAIYLNPAGLSQINTFEMSSTYADWLAQISFTNLSLVFPFKTFTCALSANYANYGQVQETTLLNPTGTGKTLIPEAYNAALSFSKRITPKLYAGWNIKILNENLAGSQDINYSEDFGILYKVSGIFSVGVSLRNVLNALGTDAIPRNYGAGFALRSDKLLLLGDLNIPNDNVPHANIGVEYAFQKNIFFRAGYNTVKEENSGGNITAGIGLVLKNMKIDYSFVPYGDLGITHRFGITISKS